MNYLSSRARCLDQYGRVSQMRFFEQARARFETASAEIPQIRREIAQGQNALSVLLGRNPGSIERGKTLAAPTLPEVPAGIPSQLLERRPDILQAEQQLIAANALIGAAKAQYFPSISLTGVLGATSTALHNLFTGPAQAWNYGGSFIGHFLRRVRLVAARARLFASAVNIYKAMGGGWVDEAAKLTSAPEPVAMPNGDKVDDK